MKMNQCCTTYKDHEITYQWVVKSFGNYINLITNKLLEIIVLKSSCFGLSESDKDRFYLELKMSSFSDDKSMSLRLYWKQFDGPVVMTCKLYILNKKREKVYMTTAKTFDTAYLNDSYGNDNFIEIEELTQKRVALLNDNNLSIGCDVIIYGKNFSHHVVCDEYKCQLHESIGDQLYKLLDESMDSDFTFYVDDKEFKAHKLILQARSRVFEAMLNHEMTENQTGQCIIPDVRPEIFQILLKFIYTDKVADKLNNEDLMALLVAADKYELNELKEICAELLCKTINCENVIELSLFAKKFHVNNFIKFTDDFIEANRDKISINVNFGYFAENMSIEAILNFPMTQSK